MVRLKTKQRTALGETALWFGLVAFALFLIGED
jgi:hypothetical protein